MKNGYKNDYHLEQKFHQFRDLRELLRYSAEVYDDNTCFITKVSKKSRHYENAVYQKTSYRQFFTEMGYLGTALEAVGLSGEKIGVIGENSYRWILSYVTAACGLGVIVPLDKALQKEELESLIERSEISCLFYDKKMKGLIDEIRAEESNGIRFFIALDFTPEEEGILSFDQLLEDGKQRVRNGDRTYLDADIDPEAMSFLLFTSGTTSQSKAVMLSHKNLMSTNWGMNCEELFFPDDVNMIILPLHHIYGFSGLVTFLSQGLTNVFCDGLRYIAMNLKEYRVSVITSVPLLLENMYKKILQAIEKNGKTEQVKRALRICNAADAVGINLRSRMFREIIDQFGGRMRFIINGAAPLDPVVQKGLNDFGILTVQGYGLTETSPTIASETYRYLKPGSCGIVMPNVKARIEDPDENGVGELVVKGDNVMLGYYCDPEATSEVLVDGWFHTGDLARIDRDGYVFISGRKKNVIVMKNGKNVFPEEIENLINVLPYVSDSVVFTRNKLNDYVLWAKVVFDETAAAESGLTFEEAEQKLEEDMEKINQSMPQYKMVKRWFLSKTPTIKTTTLKVKRHEEIRQIEKEIRERGLK